MRNSIIFKLAHKITKEIIKQNPEEQIDYKATFSLALKSVRKSIFEFRAKAMNTALAYKKMNFYKDTPIEDLFMKEYTEHAFEGFIVFEIIRKTPQYLKAQKLRNEGALEYYRKNDVTMC